MARVKRGVMTHKRHKNVLALAKGYRRMNGNVYSRAKNAIMKAGQNSYVVRPLGTNYSTFIHNLYVNKVKLNRKVLSNLAIAHPQVFEAVVKTVTK